MGKGGEGTQIICQKKKKKSSLNLKKNFGSLKCQFLEDKARCLIIIEMVFWSVSLVYITRRKETPLMAVCDSTF